MIAAFLVAANQADGFGDKTDGAELLFQPSGFNGHVSSMSFTVNDNGVMDGYVEDTYYIDGQPVARQFERMPILDDLVMGLIAEQEEAANLVEEPAEEQIDVAQIKGNPEIDEPANGMSVME